jgi:hypothetical protein
MFDLVANRADFTEPESFFTAAEAWADLEGPLGADIQNLLELTGIQQDLLDPVLRLVGSPDGMFTSRTNSINRPGRDHAGALMRPWN